MRIVTLFLVLGIGFLAGAISVSRALAEAGPTMKYAYQCFTKWPDGDTPKMIDKVNEQGKQGWRLLPARPADGGAFCFERPY